MLNNIKEKIKAIAKDIAVAFFFTTFILFLTGLILNKNINTLIVLVNKLGTGSYVSNLERKDITINKVKKRLETYPYYGDRFGTISIPSVNIDIALYHGEALRVLQYGAGHHAGSYFPGEGGTIIIAAHNTWGQFYTLPQVSIGDKVIIKTDYGTYTYEINKTEIANAIKLGEDLRIRTDLEELMLYTCYPVDSPGYKANRFVAYAVLVGEEDV